MNGSLTKKVRVKNSLFHREVRPEYKGWGLGKHQGGEGYGRGTGKAHTPAGLPPSSSCSTQPLPIGLGLTAPGPPLPTLPGGDAAPSRRPRSLGPFPDVEGPRCPIDTCPPISHSQLSVEPCVSGSSQEPPLSLSLPHHHPLLTLRRAVKPLGNK